MQADARYLPVATEILDPAEDSKDVATEVQTAINGIATLAAIQRSDWLASRQREA